jgi:ribonuclease HI
MALGAVLVILRGQHTVSQDTHRTGCNNEAEVLALLAALECCAQQAQHAHIYSDSSILWSSSPRPSPSPWCADTAV